MIPGFISLPGVVNFALIRRLERRRRRFAVGARLPPGSIIMRNAKAQRPVVPLIFVHHQRRVVVYIFVNVSFKSHTLGLIFPFPSLSLTERRSLRLFALFSARINFSVIHQVLYPGRMGNRRLYRIGHSSALENVRRITRAWIIL